MSREKTSFREYFVDAPMVDRFQSDSDRAVDVIIPVIHTNELWRANLLALYREVPVNRLILGDGGCIDDSLVIADAFPRVEVLDHREFKSLGFSLRRLIEAVETPFFIYLHSDIFLPAGWFDAMYGARDKHDWFESGQNTVIMVKSVAPTLEVARAYSGSQMGRKAAFEAILPTIEDDYLYRNEDIILANLIKAAGYRYGKVDTTFSDHQQIFKESPWLRRVKRVNFELELGENEEIRAAMTYVKGIVKYLRPDQSEDLISSLHENISRLVELGALEPGEFSHWVSVNHPEWAEVFPPPAPEQKSLLDVMLNLAAHESTSKQSVLSSHVRRPPSFKERLRWLPSALFRKTGRFFDRIANRLMPPGRPRGY
jgi:hypothetical protein